MCGSAMFTTVASRMIMSWALSMMVRATLARLEGLASRVGVSRVRKEDNVPPRRSGSRAVPRRGIPVNLLQTSGARLRVPDFGCQTSGARLRVPDFGWLTDRWPGGTIGNETEVYSGYYTEAASVLQPDLRRGR